MKTDLIIPRLTYTMESCTFAELLVDNRQYVEKGQPIANVIVDKADVEFTAERTGYIQINCQSGDEFNVLDVYGFIADTQEELLP